MLDEATLATMIGGFLWLVYHCREWKAERSEFTQWMDSRFETFAERSGDAMEVLEDILDGLGSGPAPGGSAHPPSGMADMLTQLLMTSITNPGKHAESQEREIQIPEQDETSPETEN